MKWELSDANCRVLHLECGHTWVQVPAHPSVSLTDLQPCLPQKVVRMKENFPTYSTLNPLDEAQDTKVVPSDNNLCIASRDQNPVAFLWAKNAVYLVLTFSPAIASVETVTSSEGSIMLPSADLAETATELRKVWRKFLFACLLLKVPFSFSNFCFLSAPTFSF